MEVSGSCHGRKSKPKLRAVKPACSAAPESFVGRNGRPSAECPDLAIEAVSPGSDEARGLIDELDIEIGSLYRIPAFSGYVGIPISRCYAKRA